MNQRCNEISKKGGGWVIYEFANPATKVVMKKRTRIESIRGTTMYVMCGIFIDARDEKELDLSES